MLLQAMRVRRASDRGAGISWSLFTGCLALILASGLALAQDPPAPSAPAAGDKPGEAKPSDPKPAEDKPGEPAPGGKEDEPGTAAPAPSQPITNRELYQRVLKSVCYVAVPDGSGTGWLIDKAERLVFTNHHVVELNDDCRVFFPEYKDGELIAEQKYYSDRAHAVRGHVFDSDGKRDLAVIQLEELPDGVEALQLAEQVASPGDEIFSIGNPGSSDALWVFTQGLVRQRYHNSWRFGTGQFVDAQVIETQSPTNPGDSGGPVVNERAELVAVVCAHNTQARLSSSFIDVSEVKAMRDDILPLLHPTTAEQYATRGTRYRHGKRHDRAIEDLTKAISMNPKMALAYANRGWAFANKRDFDTAIGDFAEAISLDPTLADAYHGRGYLYIEQGKYDEGIEDCTKAIRMNPKNDIVYNNRAFAYRAKQEYTKSVGDYTRAIEISPNDPTYYNERGDSYYYGQDYQSAVKDYLRATEVDSTFALGWFNLGYTYLMNLRDNDQALNYFNKAIEVNNRYAAAYECRGEAWWGKKEYERALADYNAALEIDSTYAEAYHDRGYLYHYNLNNAQQALNDYNEAIRLNPNSSKFYSFRGHLYYQNKDYDRALADYSSALQLTPNDASLLRSRGNTYAAKGDQNRAAADYAEAARIDPTSSADPPKPHDRRLLYVANKTGRSITVYVQYHTKATNGNWIWFPNAPGQGDSLRYDFVDGEEAYLKDRGLNIRGDKIRIWAVTNDGGEWLRDRDQDVIMCREMYQASQMETFTYTFEP